MRLLGLLPFLLSFASAQPAPAPKTLTLHEIVDRANKSLRGDSSHGNLTMTIVTPDWKRSLDVEGWNLGRQMAYILIHSPAKDKGNATLRRHTEMWLWLTKVERVIKVPPTMMHSSWQGSDFNYEDIVKADSVVKDYEHALLETRREEGRTVYKIQGIPKPDAPVVWGKVLMNVAVYPGDEVVPIDEQDFSERGDLIRTITLSDVKRMNGRLIPTKLECVPAKKPGRRTLLEYHNIEFDIPLQDSFFSMARLQKGGR
jgi:hypothetical protein